jgi:hypothetical protein
VTAGDITEAEAMTGLLTGATLAGLTRIAHDYLTPPVQFLGDLRPGFIHMRLASGMLVTVTIHVEPTPTSTPDHTQPA